MSLKKVCFGVFPAAMAADCPIPFHLDTSMMAGERLRGPRRAMIESDFQFPSDYGCVCCRWLSLGPSLMVAFPGSDSGFFWDTAQGSFLWLHATLLASPTPVFAPPYTLSFPFIRRKESSNTSYTSPAASGFFPRTYIWVRCLSVPMGGLLTESSSPWCRHRQWASTSGPWTCSVSLQTPWGQSL